MNSVKVVAQFSYRHSSMYPLVGYLGRRLFILPVSTVDCERASADRTSSKQTCVTLTLKIESLSNIMMISIEEPTSESFPYEDAFNMVASMKTRGIL